MPALFNAFVAYHFIKTLVTPWDKTEAYKRGLIDNKGHALMKRSEMSSSDKKHFTLAHTVIWNIKRLLDKLPPTQTKLGSFAVALWLMKTKMAKNIQEDTCVEEIFLDHLEYEYDVDLSEFIVESVLFSEAGLEEGDYQIVSSDICDMYEDVEVGDLITLESTVPIYNMLGCDIYMGTHKDTQRKVAVTNEHVQQIS